MRRFSTKQKRELYSLSSLLFHLIIFVVLLISLGTDADDKTQVAARKVDAPKATQSSFERFFTLAHQKI